MVVGDRRGTLFWHHRWVRDTPLATQFPHIYEISRSKDAKVFELYTLNGLVIERDLKIRNRLNGQQKADKRELMNVLDLVQLNPN